VAKGVRIRSEPRDFKEVRVCFFFDPDGNVLELAEDPRQSAHP
jgi:catechol 2,3-dioxygenase-like lactoylglutathione lyase family enzyme